MDELVVFLIRELGWSLEYTVELVKTLPIKKLNALIEELKYQKDIENYQIASNFAMVLSNWASSKGKRSYSISDFIGQPPTRGKKDDLLGAAEREGIILPKEGT